MESAGHLSHLILFYLWFPPAEYATLCYDLYYIYSIIYLLRHWVIHFLPASLSAAHRCTWVSPPWSMRSDKNQVSIWDSPATTFSMFQLTTFRMATKARTKQQRLVIIESCSILKESTFQSRNRLATQVAVASGYCERTLGFLSRQWVSILWKPLILQMANWEFLSSWGEIILKPWKHGQNSRSFALSPP